MKSTVENLEGLYKKLNIEVPAEKVKTAFQEAYTSLQKSVEIKGFRKGKAPIAKIKAMYADRVKDDVLNNLVSEGYQTALGEHSLNPLGYPKLDFDELKDDGAFTFSAEFEIRPEVSVDKFEGLKIEREKLVINEDQITNVLENIRTSQAETAPVLEDRNAQDGDIAIINFDGFVDGQPLEGGSAKDHELELGASQFIEGFEEGVVGMKIGASKELNLSFPNEYHNADIAGKPVLFKVTLNSLKKKVLPELNDELAKKTGQFETLDELKTAIKEDLEKNEQRRIQEDLKNKVLKQLVEANPVTAPQTLVDQQKQMIMDDVRQKLSQQGMGDKEFEEYKEKWQDDFNDSATFMVQSTFLVDALADKLSLRPTAQDIEAKIADYAAESGIEIERLQEFYQEPERKSRLGFQLTEEKVIATLIEKADVTEVEPKVEVEA